MCEYFNLKDALQDHVLIVSQWGFVNFTLEIVDPITDELRVQYRVFKTF